MNWYSRESLQVENRHTHLIARFKLLHRLCPSRHRHNKQLFWCLMITNCLWKKPMFEKRKDGLSWMMFFLLCVLAILNIRNTLCFFFFIASLARLHSQCNAALGMKTLFDMLYAEPKKVMLFGDACNSVTDPIAKASRFFHLIQVNTNSNTY